MRKITYLTLTAIFVLLLCACTGGEGTQTSTPDITTAAVASATPEPAETPVPEEPHEPDPLRNIPGFSLSGDYDLDSDGHKDTILFHAYSDDIDALGIMSKAELIVQTNGEHLCSYSVEYDSISSMFEKRAWIRCVEIDSGFLIYVGTSFGLAGDKYICVYFDGEKLQRADWDFATDIFNNEELPKLFDCEWTDDDTFRIKSNISADEAECVVKTEDLAALIGKPWDPSKGFWSRMLEMVPYQEGVEYEIETNKSADELDIFATETAEFCNNVYVSSRFRFKFVPETVSWELVFVEFNPGEEFYVTEIQNP